MTIYDYGRTESGEFYYAMELLDGMTLQEIVQADGPLPEARVVHALRQCAMALDEAHSFGLVHRDIKPNNIMMTQQGGVHDVTKVLDFGLVKNVDMESGVSLTWTEGIVGTPLFMSPEQIRDPLGIDGRSDLYALGAVGYYLLTGCFVFGGTNPLEVCAQHLSAIPEAPSTVGERDIDPGLEGLIMRCLEKKRDARPSSGAEICEALEAIPIEPWSQANAAAWWETVGADLLLFRTEIAHAGSLATLHAQPDRAGA